MDHDQYLKTTDLTHKLKYRKYTCKEQNIFDQELFRFYKLNIKPILAQKNKLLELKLLFYIPLDAISG